MIEFSVASWHLTSTLGTYTRILAEDDGAGPFWRVVPDQCDAGADLRVQDDPLPQTDGYEIHPHFRNGFQLRMALQPYDGGAIAIDSVRRQLWENLNAHLEAIRNADGRLQWRPSGYSDDRILDNIRLIERSAVSGSGIVKTVTFAVASRFPYYIDFTQQDIALPATVTNAGNAAFHPVVKVHGPITTGFTLSSSTDLDEEGNPKQLIYDTSLPNAPTIASGHYIEFDFFRNTATLDGNVNFTPEAGIDWSNSDWFEILKGANAIGFTGDGTAELLNNNAWAA